MSGPGRPRDEAIDQAVLAAAQRHLADVGYEAMSVAAVAAEAGTTRQALYRRWPTKADLATAAIASLAQATSPPPTDDPFHDLVAELRSFQRGVLRPNGLSMVGTMLQASTDPDLVARYRQRVVEPRRARLRAVFERARRAGLLPADGDLDTAVAAATGALYGRALAGATISRSWPERTARFLWRALGGTPPSGPRRRA